MRTEEELTRRAVWIAMFVALATVGQLVASRAVRDGFFLSHFPASDLPKMMIAAGLLSVTVVLLSARAFRGIPPAQYVPWLFAFSAFLYTLEWLLAGYYPSVAAIGLYLHVVSIGLLVASGFWSVVNERFDPYTAKLSIGRIAGGATLGGVLGGVVAWAAAQRIDVPTMLLALAFTNALCAVGINRLGRGSRPIRGMAEEQGAALSILAGQPYLRNLALLVALGAFCQACYEYVFKSTVAGVYTDGSDLVSFFALFYMGLNVVTFLIQNLLTKPVLNRYGLSFTVGSLHGTGVLFGIIGLLAPGLTSAIAMRGSIGAVENSIFRSGYELLYTPVLPDQKRPTKTLIDVGGEMTGGVLGAGAAFLALASIPDMANVALITAGIAASIGGLYLTRLIRFGYVKSLADTLEAENIDLEEAAFGSQQSSLTPQPTPTFTSVTGQSASVGVTGAEKITRAELSDYLQTRKPGTAGDWSYVGLAQSGSVAEEGRDADSLARAVLDLHSGDATRVARVLAVHHPLPRLLVEPTIQLLADPHTADRAQRALRYVAPVHLGALLDALRSDETDKQARRRVCSILGRVPTQRCVDGLLALVDQVDEALRLRIAGSLLRIRRNNPDLHFDRERVFELARREAQHCRRVWFSRVALDSRLSAAPPLESADGRRVIQGSTFITTLLLTILDQQPAILATRSLAHTSAARRGAGIEYLENVLPPDLLRLLQPLLVDTRLALGQASTRAEILTELESGQRQGTSA